MRRKYIWKNYKFVSLLLIIFVLIGCGRNSQKPNPEKQKHNSPKLPKILRELEDEVLKIMYDLDSVTGIEKAIEKEKLTSTEEMSSSVEAAAQSSQSNDKKNSKSSKEEEDKKEEGKKKSEEKVDMQKLIKENKIIIPLLDANDVKGSFAKSPTPPTDITKVWTKINDSVTEVHKKWNVLEAQLIPVNVPLAKAEEFEKILNDLTLSVMNNEKLNSLKLANELTRITTDFRSYFDGAANHGVYGMYYHIRGSILFAASDNYVGALQHLDEASKIASSLRQDLIKQDSQDILQKFELSIEDLRKQLEDENFYLSQIKAPIVIKNIKLMQDVFEAQKNK
ncbi:hypothetical protein [Alkaliphilus sp. B6464]|uniref:hypothetical protein n=1 Tax=Alkaliphilus sp. B6464 TaxID=2731219 RepID=UPI001BA4B4B8|nr:hypothetical protein [Alkaliphilus sp. B6464]QUH18752.1 hypothetical protein HYG84_01725 [Alkaliphilus sp. B6464]